MGRVGILAVVLVASLAACERERIEVAESSATGGDGDGDADASPMFPVVEDGLDASVSSCGPPPTIGRCPPCANGYVTLPDGGSTCECCP